jgi:phage host-nuclease inhibitor protein Gam
MKTLEKITTWEEADQVLANLALGRRQLETLAIARDDQVQRAKADCDRQGAPILDRIAALEAELHRFALTHQEDLAGRSKQLTFGRVGFLLVHEVGIRSVKKAIAWLVESKRWAYLRVKHELNKETLRDAPPEVLKACGARVRSRDQFWYEIDDQRVAVE